MNINPVLPAIQGITPAGFTPRSSPASSHSPPSPQRTLDCIEILSTSWGNQGTARLGGAVSRSDGIHLHSIRKHASSPDRARYFHSSGLPDWNLVPASCMHDPRRVDRHGDFMSPVMAVNFGKSVKFHACALPQPLGLMKCLELGLHIACICNDDGGVRTQSCPAVNKLPRVLDTDSFAHGSPLHKVLRQHNFHVRP